MLSKSFCAWDATCDSMVNWSAVLNAKWLITAASNVNGTIGNLTRLPVYICLHSEHWAASLCLTKTILFLLFLTIQKFVRCNIPCSLMNLQATKEAANDPPSWPSFSWLWRSEWRRKIISISLPRGLMQAAIITGDISDSLASKDESYSTVFSDTHPGKFSLIDSPSPTVVANVNQKMDLSSMSLSSFIVPGSSAVPLRNLIKTYSFSVSTSN